MVLLREEIQTEIPRLPRALIVVALCCRSQDWLQKIAAQLCLNAFPSTHIANAVCCAVLAFAVQTCTYCATQIIHRARMMLAAESALLQHALQSYASLSTSVYLCRNEGPCSLQKPTTTWFQESILNAYRHRGAVGVLSTKASVSPAAAMDSQQYRT